MSLNSQLRYNKGKAKKLEENMRREEEGEDSRESKNNKSGEERPTGASHRRNEEAPPPSSGSKSRKRKRRLGDSSFALPSTSKANKLRVDRPKERFSDLGGISRILQDVRELIEYPIQHPEIYSHLGVEPPRGILLHGPPGCGKTMMANAIAGEIDVPFFKISAPEIVSGMSGESEEKIRSLFDTAAAAAPSLIFIDEIDAITPKRETSARGMERRMVAQLLTCLDNLTLEATSGKAVIVIGATNRPQSLDAALRRAGRFDREICMPVPDTKSREKILAIMTRKMRTEGNFNFKEIARKTPGYVGADLKALTKEAAVVAVNRVFKELQELHSRMEGEEDEATASNNGRGRSNSVDDRTAVSNHLRSQSGTLSPRELDDLFVTMEDFMKAVKKVQPSAKREGFATVPNVTWKDIGALQNVRAELKMSILEPIRDPERFEAVGLSIPAGVLLFGPRAVERRSSPRQ